MVILPQNSGYYINIVSKLVIYVQEGIGLFKNHANKTHLKETEALTESSNNQFTIFFLSINGVFASKWQLLYQYRF